MRDWASSGRIKIDRTNEHVDDLEDRIETFRKRDPYRIGRECDPEHGGVILVVWEVEPIPPMWGAVAADAIHNLHVALDHLWKRAIYGPRQTMGDSFPAFPDPQSAKARFGGKEHGRLKKAVDILRSVDAFEVGNPFWTIRCFDDADKHDTMALVAYGISHLRFDVEYPGGKMLKGYIPPEGRSPLIRLKDRAVLFRAPPSVLHVNVYHNLSFQVAFGESEVLEGEAVVPTLKYLTQSVDALAGAFIDEGLLT